MAKEVLGNLNYFLRKVIHMSYHFSSYEPELKPLPKLPRHLSDWQEAATQSRIGITPYSAKVLYTFGVMRHSIEASGMALSFSDKFYLCAYLQASTAVELLGRCLLGDQCIVNGSGDRLRRGIQYIACLPNSNRETSISIPRSLLTYSIGDCENLRNLIAHGSGVSKGHVIFDAELIKHFLNLLSSGMEKYARDLKDTSDNGRDASNKLAIAAIMPMFCGKEPLFIKDVYKRLIKGGTVASNLLYQAAWRL